VPEPVQLEKPFTASTLIMLSFGPVTEPFSGWRNMRGKSPQWFRLIALTAALAALLVTSTGVTFWHQDSPGTVCSICYAAHSPALRSLPVRTPVASYALAWLIPAELLLTHATPQRLNSPPRAPPA
jgi:hypothetical protein